MRVLPGCVCLCLRPCAVSHAIPLPRLTLHKHDTLMSLSDGYFMPPPPPPPSPAHTVNITFIFILGVWHRYRSETVAGDLSLSIMCSHNCMNKRQGNSQYCTWKQRESLNRAKQKINNMRRRLLRQLGPG